MFTLQVAYSTETQAPIARESAAASISIKLPFDSKDPAYRERGLYSRDLVQLILSKTDVHYSIEMVDIPKVPSDRNMRLLKKGIYTIAPFHTNPEREKELLPIRIPIYRGLAGWRLFFIRPDDKQFENVTSADYLKRFVAGQGHDWPDTLILKANHFSVLSAYSRDSLFRHLQAGRIDYFPRSLYEIWGEQDIRAAKGLVIDKDVVLHYPSATYFFVKKEDQALAEQIELGFERAIEDGSFKALFMRYMGEAIRKANLPARKLIEIPNPFLSNQTPLDRQDYWFSLNDLPTTPH